jgi:hypothetical protein
MSCNLREKQIDEINDLEPMYIPPPSYTNRQLSIFTSLIKTKLQPGYKLIKPPIFALQFEIIEYSIVLIII